MPELLSPDEASVLAAEIATRYALHTVDACLGEPVEIIRNKAGLIKVTARVGTPERKEELLRALEAVRNSPWVKIDVSTVGEAVASKDARELPEAASSGETLRQRGIPVESYLRRLFEHAQEPGSVPPVSERVVRLTNMAYNISEDLLAHAWALRRLSDAYGAPRPVFPTPQSRWLLEMMIQDHSRALHAKARQLETLLSPALDLMAGGAARPPYKATRQQSGWGWANSNLSLFYSAERIHQLVLALFAGAQMPSVGDRSGGAQGEAGARVITTGEAAEDLESALEELSQRFAVALDDATKEFPGLVARKQGLLAPEVTGALPQEVMP